MTLLEHAQDWADAMKAADAGPHPLGHNYFNCNPRGTTKLTRVMQDYFGADAAFEADLKSMPAQSTEVRWMALAFAVAIAGGRA